MTSDGEQTAQQSTRRAVLRSLGVAAVGALAGCTGDDGEETPESTPTPEATPTPEPTPTATPTPEPTPTPEETLAPDAFGQRSERFFGFLDDGDVDEAHDEIASRATEDLSTETLSQFWNSLTGQYGAFDGVASVDPQGTEDGLDYVLVDLSFENGNQTLELYFQEGKIAGIFPADQTQEEWTAPAYADESAFVERELTLEATPDCSLGATLSVPTDAESVPGVVLVHGNGPNDRDGTIGPNKPLKELAWGLASNGIAVLRYDKRTQACDVDLADATIDDVVTDDAVTAVERLREQDPVADDQVFVAGHSFGGTMAPRIAERDGNLAGVVMLAPGPVRSFAETLRDQNTHLNEIGAISDEQLEQSLELADRIESRDIADDEMLLLGGKEFYESFADYDRTGTAADLSVPRLLLFGGQDWQVTVENDLPVWEDALSDDSGATFTVYDNLNHMFQQSTGEETQAEYTNPDAVLDGRVVEDVVEFVQTNS